MSRISVATIISRAVELRYPIIEVLESVAPIAAEIVVNVDASRPDGTYELVRDWLQKQYKGGAQIFKLPWNWDNHERGTEFAIQSNVAASMARGSWVLYIQADELLHEDHHEELRWLADNLAPEFDGVEFERLCFWRDFGTLRRDWTLPMVRMFRKDRGKVVGDSMFCACEGQVWPVLREGAVPVPSLFHYSRVGNPEVIAARIQANDEMHHPAEEVARGGRYDFVLRSYDSYARSTDPGLVTQSVLAPFVGSHPAPVSASSLLQQFDMAQERSR